MNDYSFNLQFSELDEDLQEQKIDELIQYDYLQGEHRDSEGNNKQSVEEVLEDEEVRSRARDYIEAHFPLYF